jgi:hypothetical protein
MVTGEPFLQRGRAIGRPGLTVTSEGLGEVPESQSSSCVHPSPVITDGVLLAPGEGIGCLWGVWCPCGVLSTHHPFPRCPEKD